MKDSILIPSRLMGLTIIMDKLEETTQALIEILKKNSDPKYGPPDVDILIETTEQKTIVVPLVKNLGIISEPFKDILKSEPSFSVQVYFGLSRHDEKSRIIFRYIPGTNEAELITDDIKENHKLGLEEQVEEIIKFTCILVYKQAQQQLRILESWKQNVKL